MNDFIAMLLRQAVQVTSVACIVWCLTRLLARDRPHLAHALWAIVLLKCLTPPLISSPFGAFCWYAAPTAATAILEKRETVKASESAALTAMTDASESGIIVQLERASQAPTNSPVSSTLLDAKQAARGAGFKSWLSYVTRPERLIMACLLVAVLLLMRTAIRLALLLRRIRHCTVETPAAIVELGSRLQKQLGLRKQIAIRIVNAPLGPAVIGLWRPTILLPLTIVESRTNSELEPLLAHELIHIRRGDLCWALVQAVATGLWWFHPLVHYAARKLNAEAERSCDEETVRSLGCRPATYARALLDILAEKQQLHVIPTLPGVRPLDVTTKRLERIMRIGHGGHVRTPRWTSVILLLGAAITLPGTTWVHGEQAVGSVAPLTAQDCAVDSGGVRFASPASTEATSQDTRANTDALDPAPDQDQVNEGVKYTLHQVDEVVRYALHFDATRALKNIQRDDSCDPEQAKSILKALINAQLTLQESQKQRAGDLQILPRPSSTEPATSTRAFSAATIIFEDNHLVVQCAEVQRAAVRQVVDRITQHGTSQICVATRIIAIPAEQLKTLDVKWRSLLPDDAPTDAQVKDEHARTSPRGEAFVPRQTATLVSVVDAEAAQKLVEQFQADRRANLLQAPKVTLFNAQDATIQDLVERPFVVSVTETLQPIVRTIKEGLELWVRPTLNETRDELTLDCNLTLQAIESVGEVSFKHAAASEHGGVTLQVPKVTRHDFAVKGLQLTPDATLLITGIQADQPSLMTIAMLSVSPIQLVNAVSTVPVPPAPAVSWVTVTPKLSHRKASLIINKLTAEGIADVRHQGQHLQVGLSSWREALQIVSEFLRSDADDIEESKSPDLIISARGQSTAESQRLAEALDARGLHNVSVRGNVCYHVEDNALVVYGTELTFQDGSDPEEMFLYGDTVEMRLGFGDDEQLAAALIGNARLKCASENLDVSAHTIRLQDRVLTMKGNVQIVQNGGTLVADRVTYRLDGSKAAPANSK
ncbi:MAG: hypothetical protein KDA92_00465 [Planctomycetales bacterium]|nr:hypothetical protein [Planctomycetales bacterium]